jgi:hypothetical protein
MLSIHRHTTTTHHNNNNDNRQHDSNDTNNMHSTPSASASASAAASIHTAAPSVDVRDGQLSVYSFTQLRIQPSTIQLKYSSGMQRYCRKCQVWKPDRSHHCSVHHRCILGLDHCCGVLNNCIGIYNRKYFIQFLYSLSFVAMWMIYVTMKYKVWRWYNWQLNTFKWLLSCYILVISIACFITLFAFATWHVYLMAYNMTSVEWNEGYGRSIRSIQRHPYDCGSILLNLKSVLGDNIIEWFLPTSPKLHYSQNKHLQTEWITIPSSSVATKSVDNGSTAVNRTKTKTKTSTDKEAERRYLKLVCDQIDYAVCHRSPVQPITPSKKC